MKTQWIGVMLVCAILSVSAGESAAATLGGVEIHGFGGWAYGKTDNENRYLTGNEDGNYDNVNFSLNISANPYEKFSVYFQSGFNEEYGASEILLDYAFAEWRISDLFILRAGKVKAPFMIYTEVYDVGTLRPFYSLAPGIYQQFAAEAYKGVGFTGSVFSESGWGILYDMYGGTMNLFPQKGLDTQQAEFQSLTPIVNDILGGRLTLQTPLDGLSILASAYSGDVEGATLDDEGFTGRYTFVGLSGEYLLDRWLFRGEYLFQRQKSDVKLDMAYVEGTYTFFEHWQAAVRYEWTNIDIDFLKTYILDSYFEHQDLAFGLNYWLNPSMVFKLAYHIVDGNRFANPETVEGFLEALQRGSFEEQTSLISFGAQFSF